MFEACPEASVMNNQCWKEATSRAYSDCSVGVYCENRQAWLSKTDRLLHQFISLAVICDCSFLIGYVAVQLFVHFTNTQHMLQVVLCMQDVQTVGKKH